MTKKHPFIKSISSSDHRTVEITRQDKIAEVKAWIRSVRDHDGEVGYIDVRAYVWKHWPELSEAETDQIVEAVE